MKILKSCRIGGRHIKNNIPCQDRYRTLTAGQREIFIIADGHGHQVHCRSSIAAAMACRAAQKVLSDVTIPYEEAPKQIKVRFDTFVKKHLQFHPLTFRERQLLYGHSPETAYGTTLLAAVVSPDGTFLLRLGDGEIHAISNDGCVLPALKGKLVSSMFSQNAVENMESVFYPQPVAAVMMFSDGFSNLEEHPVPLIEHILKMDDDQIPESILKAGDRGDDQTVILAIDTATASTPLFQSSLREYLHNSNKEKALAAVDYELQCSKAVLLSLIHKLDAIGNIPSAWERALFALLEEGATYKALASERDKFHGGN